MAVLSSDGLAMLTASDDQTARPWKTETGECSRTFSGHSGELVSAAFSLDGLLVLTASSNGWVKVWKRYGRARSALHPVKSIHCVHGDAELWSAVFSPDKSSV